MTAQLSYTSASILLIAGSAFAAKTTENFVLTANTGVTGWAGGERVGVVTPFDVTGIQSGDGPGSPINRVFFVNVAADVVTGIGWDVSLAAFGSSWRSELRVSITDSSGTGGFNLGPGTDASPGGPTNYSSVGNILKLANYSIPNVYALTDGLIRLEFFESYDDVAGAYEGLWSSGFLYIQGGFPTPASVSLLAVAGVGLLHRKRR